MNYSMPRRYQQELSVLAAWLLMLAGLAVAAPGFYRGDQVRLTLVAAAPILVAAIGTTLVMLAGQIDISVGSLFSPRGVEGGIFRRYVEYRGNRTSSLAQSGISRRSGSPAIVSTADRPGASACRPREQNCFGP